MKLDWHTFAGDEYKGRTRYSFQAITGGLNGREMYLIDPRVSPYGGSGSGYTLRYFGAGGYHGLGSFRAPAAAKKAAQNHFDNIKHKNPSDILTGKSITTEYFGPTNTRGARIKASVIDGRKIQKSISISYPHELDMYDAHILAANTLRDKMNWQGDLIGVSTQKGYAFGFAHFKRTRQNPRKRIHKSRPQTQGVRQLRKSGLRFGGLSRAVSQSVMLRKTRKNPGTNRMVYVEMNSQNDSTWTRLPGSYDTAENRRKAMRLAKRIAYVGRKSKIKARVVIK